MRKTSGALIAALLFVTINLLFMSESYAQQKKYEPLIGTWNLTVLIEGVEQYSTFTFQMKKDTLKGVWDGEFGPIPMKNITFARDTLRCSLFIDTGMEFFTIRITGIVKKDKMNGSGISDLGDYYPFTATKRKPKKGLLNSVPLVSRIVCRDK